LRYAVNSAVALKKASTATKIWLVALAGRILFSLFDDAEAGPIFMIAMIKQKGGVVLNDDFIPIDIVEVDLSKLHQASQIRIDHFLSDQKIDSAVNHEDQDRNYLSFLSPKSSTHASGYFISALGCVIGITPSHLGVSGHHIFDHTRHRQNLSK
jgi:nucleoid-associated protein